MVLELFLGKDVARAKELGAKGILVASGIVKAKKLGKNNRRIFKGISLKTAQIESS